MSDFESRLRRFALRLGLGSVVLGTVSFVALFWVASQTDMGLTCDTRFPDELRSVECSFYDVPWWALGVSALVFVIALILLVASLLVPRQPSRP